MEESDIRRCFFGRCGYHRHYNIRADLLIFCHLVTGLFLCFFLAPHFFFNLNLWSVVSRATALRRHLVDVNRRTVLTAIRLLVAPNEGYD